MNFDDVPALNIPDQRLNAQINFIMEMDKLKAVERMTKIISTNRFENDAEHSWHAALMALILEPYAKKPVDIGRVINMLLVHDIVEIDAGDTYIYGGGNPTDQFEKELKAAKRIFGLLPNDQAKIWLDLWQEFEAHTTADAKFAKAIDRFSPFIYYGFAGEGCLIEQGVNTDMMRAQMKSIADFTAPMQKLFEKIVLTYSQFGVVHTGEQNQPPCQPDALAKAMHNFDYGSDDLTRRFTFIMEMDKLKSVLRQTQLISVDRAENDAEHSWNLALMAAVLREYANKDVDILRVVKMLLIHDVIEIDAGDAPLYDKKAQEGKQEREQKAATRLFGLLPASLATQLHQLWLEFEQHKSVDAKFARAIDRLSPLLYNYHTKGVRWQKFGVNADEVRLRLCVIDDGSSKLWQLALGIINQSVKEKYLPG